MAADFDLLVTVTSESIRNRAPVLLGPTIGSLVISRWYHVGIPIISGRRAAILIFSGRGLKYCETWDIRKNVLVLPTDQ